MSTDPNEVSDSVICKEPIAISHIARDISGLTEDKLPRNIKDEMLAMLCQGRTRIRYSHRWEERNAGSSAGVDFSGHVFQDNEIYMLVYRAVMINNALHWELQGIFNLYEPFPYQW